MIDPRPVPGGLFAVRLADGRVHYCIVAEVQHRWSPAEGGSTELSLIPDPFGPDWPDPNRPGRAQP